MFLVSLLSALLDLHAREVKVRGSNPRVIAYLKDSVPFESPKLLTKSCECRSLPSVPPAIARGTSAPRAGGPTRRGPNAPFASKITPARRRGAHFEVGDRIYGKAARRRAKVVPPGTVGAAKPYALGNFGLGLRQVVRKDLKQ